MKAQTDNPESSRMRRFVYACLIAMAVLVLLGVGWFALWRSQLRRELNSRIAAIHAQGFPVNWEELAGWPCEVPDSENAALIYTNAIGHLYPDGVTDKSSSKFELPPRNET